MSKILSGSISKDFPLYHADIIPIYETKEKQKHNNKKINDKNVITNEHPDIFRLEGVKEGGYKNPFLEQVAKVDRNEYYKKLSSDRKNVNLIDFIKSNRKYSQNPEIIRYINSDFNNELMDKKLGRSKNLSENKDNTKENGNRYNNNQNYNILTEGNENKIKYKNITNELNFFIPKINYRIKRTLDIENKRNNSLNYNNISANLENDPLYKKITGGVEQKISNNLRNSLNFKINNNGNLDNDEFKFVRKSINQYNPIKDKMETINPPPYINDKWSSFLENYFLSANSTRQFKRKGGYFSEFTNKNIGSINNYKFDLKQNLLKQKEEKDKNLKKLFLKN